LHERLKGHSSVQWRRQLEVSQWLPTDALQALRTQRLRRFLMDIGERVPYYQGLFRHYHFDPAAVKSLNDLGNLPLLEKADIRAHLESFKAHGHGPLTRYNTGGSSGEPLIFYMDRARKSHDVAAKWRATRWWGVDIGDPEMVVWGSPIELGAQDRLRRLRDGVLRSHLLGAFDMSVANLDRYMAAIVSARPKMLFGYPSSLVLIADHAHRRNISLSQCGIQVVFVTSERLYDSQRARISEAFGCPVANGYGARDAGFIAHECPMGSMHISAEDIVVETIRPDGQPSDDGEVGEIVVTHMATLGFPFVRYRTGDMGALSSRRCACGRGLPVLGQLEGRTTDFVVARDGTVLHGLALIYTVRDLPEVTQFQIRQISLDLTVVMIVCNTALSAASDARIVRDFKARLGESVEVRVEIVDTIAPEPSGKYRYVTSQVDAFAVHEGHLQHA
jgi:phenylacetate-CoA ligase